MSKNAEIEKAWDSFLGSIKTLTEAGCITWVRKEGDLHADLIMELMEGEDLTKDWQIKVWNHAEEEEASGGVVAYTSNTKAVQGLGSMLLKEVPYTDSGE